jgi:putative flippase GtrA
MLVPLRYQPTSTLEDPSQGLGSGPGAARTGAPRPGRREPGAGLSVDGRRARARTGGLHPLHWFVEGHWLGRRRTPKLLRIWRYGAGSVVAFVTSTVAFYLCVSLLGFGAITSTVIAFFAGAIPNWALNRQWAWEKRGREGITRETLLYLAISAVSLVFSSVITKLTAVEAGDLQSLHMVRDVLVTGGYVFSVVVLSGLKYVAYNRFVFVDRARSRAQDLTTTEANRQP